MKQHTQLWTGKNGSCLATCVACILDLELEEVPHFTAFVRWMEAMDLWCWQHGIVWHQATLAANPPDRCWIPHRHDSTDAREIRPPCRLPIPKDGLVIAGGESPRVDQNGVPMGHAVVWDIRRNRLVWDPHPSRDGIIGDPIRWYWFSAKELK